MSIESGRRYQITNEQNRLSVDLFESHDNSIIGHGLHGGANQQWITEQDDDGQWTIQSVSGQKYIGFANTPKDGTILVGLNKAQLWDIEILPDSDYHDNLRAKFWVRDTLLVVEFPDERAGIPVRLELWASREGKNQVWLLKECP